jgi:hypothetical protein
MVRYVALFSWDATKDRTMNASTVWRYRSGSVMHWSGLGD